MLEKCGHLHKLSFHAHNTPNLPENLFSSENTLLVLDEQTSLPQKLMDECQVNNNIKLIILALESKGDNNLDLQDIPLNIYDDTIIKTDNQDFLNKRIILFINFIRSQTLKSNDIDSHEAIKKNINLTNQIMHLQGQLNRFNTDLQAQEEVLTKITQISQLSRQINCLNLKKIALVCIEKIPELISARFASLYSYDDNNNTLQLLRHNHPYTIDKNVDLSLCPDSPMAIAIRQNQMLLIKDFKQWSKSEEIDVKRQFTRNYQTNSCIIAPLRSGGHISGLLNLADKIDGPSFDHMRDMPPIELLCEIIGSAMSNINLYDKVRIQARTDGMTGLVNHNTFYNELDKEVNRSKRYGGNLSLIMVDLDCLKTINDDLGHRAGDAALLHVAEQILLCVRETDIAARYGGDEFAIILPNTSLSDALIVAQRLLKMVNEKVVNYDKHEIKASISIGLSQYQEHYSTEEFMREADTALLDAKNKGKNRVHISEPVKN